ncbi:hypothetical protein GPECTOR_4g575 [Gonium pectorale]|uniref:Uncharacterized protein n=1 Tax=Gonium pectorale TaxID=33097 RepID=A0A150GYU9_GONPE|nr:hypothetical protein GPECTOR_4g575 [Gonium pectorale]|eukprot:KXZ54510.1 hypothetical protein GPECTOR_4g575 [Gonium pectorale]
MLVEGPTPPPDAMGAGEGSGQWSNATTAQPTCARGQLTRVGYQQAVALGRWLRERYGGEAEAGQGAAEERRGGARQRLSSPLAQAVAAHSTHVPRALLSLQGVLEGLLSAQLGADRASERRRLTVPVEVAPQTQPLLFANTEEGCPRLGRLARLMDRAVHARSRGPSAADEARVLKALSMPQPSPHSLPLSWKRLLDAAMCEEAAMANIGTPAAVASGAPTTARSAAATRRPLLGGLDSELYEMVDKQLFSGHDTSIFPLMAALGHPLERWPPFASNLVFELHRLPAGTRVPPQEGAGLAPATATATAPAVDAATQAATVLAGSWQAGKGRDDVKLAATAGNAATAAAVRDSVKRGSRSRALAASGARRLTAATAKSTGGDGDGLPYNFRVRVLYNGTPLRLRTNTEGTTALPLLESLERLLSNYTITWADYNTTCRRSGEEDDMWDGTRELAAAVAAAGAAGLHGHFFDTEQAASMAERARLQKQLRLQIQKQHHHHPKAAHKPHKGKDGSGRQSEEVAAAATAQQGEGLAEMHTHKRRIRLSGAIRGVARS